MSRCAQGELLRLLTGRENMVFSSEVETSSIASGSALVQVLHGVLPQLRLFFSQTAARENGVEDQAALHRFFYVFACSLVSCKLFSALCNLWSMWALLI